MRVIVNCLGTERRELEAPPGVTYAVTRWPDGRTLFYTTLERAKHAIVRANLAFACEVTRVVDDHMVWPMQAKGGTA